MNKELETLKRIVNEISNYKLHGLGAENWLGIQDVLSDVNILEQALTPPTAEEVCKELVRWFEINKYSVVNYDKEKKAFIYYEQVTADNKYEKVIVRFRFGLLEFNEKTYLPPHIITMICKFYENEVEVK